MLAMKSMDNVWWSVTFMLFTHCLTLAFNLDVRLPLIKLSGQREGGYFGYSVALHRTRSGVPWMLSGAPRGRNLQPGTRRSGALFKCPFTPGIHDCEQVPTDGLRVASNTSRLYGAYDGTLANLRPPVAYELKEDQWMGVALVSQGEGGKVIVCAHRYTVRDVTRFDYRVLDTKRGMLGLCYVLQEDLTLPLSHDIGYKNVVVVRDAVGGKRLEPKTNFDDHAHWGMCQLGTAAIFIADINNDTNEEKEDLALFGAPGCFAWRGNVFAQHVGTVRRYDLAVGRDNMKSFDKHGHLGLSVVSAAFFDMKVAVFASGAPHAASGRGRVHFLIRDRRSDTGMRDLKGHTLTGKRFGAGFGYSLAVVDADGDRRPDLLVGAPFDPDGGAVHLYIGGQTMDLSIVGTGNEGQFGLALASMGDLNKDGFDDFVVGAPYQGAGVVYVFLGGPNGLKSKVNKNDNSKLLCNEAASQIIRGEDLMVTLKPVLGVNKSIVTFGSALSSSGFDIDDNGYPDLVVGAFESDLVFLLRARPIIDIVSYVDARHLSNVDMTQKGCEADVSESEQTCFGFEACFSVDEEIDSELTIRFEIEAEPEKQLSRVLLKLNASDVPQRLVSNVVYIESGKQKSNINNEHCAQVVGYVGSLVADLQTPVQFSLTYSLVQEEPVMTYHRSAVMPDMNRFPILNQVQARKRFQATFKRDCGSDDLCEAQLEVTATLRDAQHELRRTPGGYYEMELGSLSDNELILEVEVSNVGEPAYLATLDVHFFSEALSFVGMGRVSEESQSGLVNAPEVRNSSWLSFDLANPLEREDRIRLPIRFHPRATLSLKILQFYMEANTSSLMATDASTFTRAVVVRRAEVRVMGAGAPDLLNVNLVGKVRGESDFSKVSEIGPQIVHRYLVRNDGPSPLDLVSIDIKWPLQVQADSPQGKWLLYLVQHPILKNGRGHCLLPKGVQANPLHLKSGSRSREEEVEDERDEDGLDEAGEKRVRRSPQLVVASENRVSSAGSENVVTFDCDRGSAKCVIIECQIYNLNVGSSASVEVRSRLWNATLLEDYNVHVDRVDIVSRSSLRVDVDVTQQVANDHAYVRTTLILSAQSVVRHKREVWWVWVVSVIVGVLVVLAIALVLRHLGFFKRSRPNINEMHDEDDDDLTDLMLSAHLEKARLNT